MPKTTFATLIALFAAGAARAQEETSSPPEGTSAPAAAMAAVSASAPAASASPQATAKVQPLAPGAYTVDSPRGPVEINGPLQSEVGRFGFTWFGTRDVAEALGAASVDLSTVGIRYWFQPRFGFEAGLGLTMIKANDEADLFPGNPTGPDGATAVGFGLQGAFLVSLARYEYVNVFFAPRLILTPKASPFSDGDDDSEDGVSFFQAGFAGEIALELFLDMFDFIRTSRAVSITLGMGLGFDYVKLSFEDSDIDVSENQTTFQTQGIDKSLGTFSGSTTGTFGFTYYF